MLQELKKHTWPDHPDYAAISIAWTRMQEVTTYVNEKKKESENITRVLEIRSKIEGVMERVCALCVVCVVCACALCVVCVVCACACVFVCLCVVSNPIPMALTP